MSVVDHLEELRWRIVKAVAAVVAAAALVFGFNRTVVGFLERPIKGGAPFSVETPIQLIFTSPGEYFMATVKIALLGGLYLALPVVLYQLLAFIGPGLLPTERRWALPIVAGAFAFFTVGMAFGYAVLLPTGLQFLVGFAPEDVRPLLSIGRYLGFAGGLMFATGLAFQLPLFLLGAAAVGVTTSYVLKRYRKQAFFAAFALAAVLTPSIDIFTQGLMAAALYGLFELSIVLIRLTGK